MVVFYFFMAPGHWVVVFFYGINLLWGVCGLLMICATRLGINFMGIKDFYNYIISIIPIMQPFKTVKSINDVIGTL